MNRIFVNQIGNESRISRDESKWSQVIAFSLLHSCRKNCIKKPSRAGRNVGAIT